MLAHTVTININGGNDQIFYPGAIVAGTVQYKAPSGERLTSVTIDFRGVTKVDPGRHSSYATEFIELFHIHEVLHNAVVPIESSSIYKWAFEFQFPCRTGPTRTGIYRDEGNEFFTEIPHTLPPRIDDSQSNEIKIEYPLYAVANETFKGMWATGDQAVRPVVCNIKSLKFLPNVESQQRSVPYQLTQSLSLSSQKKRLFGRRRSTTISIAQIGEEDFSIIAELPKILDVGWVEKSSFKIQTKENLTFKHKSTTLRLESMTHRRTAKEPHTPAFTETKVTKIITLNGTGDVTVDSVVPIHFSTAGIITQPPSFKSYNTARTYKLLTNINLTCDGQDIQVQFEAPVEIQHIVSTDELVQRQRSYTLPPPPPPLDMNFDEEVPSYSPHA